jgi:hypothetical protein
VNRLAPPLNALVEEEICLSINGRVEVTQDNYDPQHQVRVAINANNAAAFGVEISAVRRADEVIELGAERQEAVCSMTPVPTNCPLEGVLLRYAAFPGLRSGTS